MWISRQKSHHQTPIAWKLTFWNLKFQISKYNPHQEFVLPIRTTDATYMYWILHYIYMILEIYNWHVLIENTKYDIKMCVWTIQCVLSINLKSGRDQCFTKNANFNVRNAIVPKKLKSISDLTGCSHLNFKTMLKWNNRSSIMKKDIKERRIYDL